MEINQAAAALIQAAQPPNLSPNNRNSPRGARIANFVRRTPGSVSSCSTRMNQRSFSNYWSVENFSIQLELHAPGEFMLAPKFGDGDYEFVMKLFPNGKDEETAGYLSLFLLINKCPNPRLRFRVSFTVETADGPRSCHLNKNLVTINRSGIVTASKFFSLDILRSSVDIYTPRDILTIGCDLTIFGESLTWSTNLFGHPYARPVPREHKPSTSQSDTSRDDGLNELLSTGDFSDFTVVSSCGREFPTHMCVLSARSDYFKALLRNKNTREYTQKRVHFEDISGNVLEIILRHIYSSGNSMEQDGVKEHELTLDLITAVDRLMVTSMVSEIAAVLMQNVTCDNVVVRISMAAQLHLADTYQSLLEFFAAHKKECLKTTAWKDIRSEKPPLTIRILEDALLKCGDFDTVDRRIIDRITLS